MQEDSIYTGCFKSKWIVFGIDLCISYICAIVFIITMFFVLCYRQFFDYNYLDSIVNVMIVLVNIIVCICNLKINVIIYCPSTFESPCI